MHCFGFLLERKKKNKKQLTKRKINNDNSNYKRGNSYKVVKHLLKAHISFSSLVIRA